MRRCLVLACCLSALGCVTSAAAHERVYRNAEFELQEVFPAGLKVCTALSGDHPHGFYARFGSNLRDCGSPNAAASSMGVYAQWNSSFERTPWDELRTGCRERLKTLRIPGLPSIACVTGRTATSIHLEVVAMGGKWPDRDASPESRTPAIIYTAALITQPEHLLRDIAVFRHFLNLLRVLKPVSADDSECAPCTPF